MTNQNIDQHLSEAFTKDAIERIEDALDILRDMGALTITELAHWQDACCQRYSQILQLDGIMFGYSSTY
tara:strand:+ start:533 stop:739 length:207 start_codon:yes stop_codon:yes gene_type:complete